MIRPLLGQTLATAETPATSDASAADIQAIFRRIEQQESEIRALREQLGTVKQEGGYVTAWIGKAGLVGDEGSLNLAGNGSKDFAAHPLNRGFDRFFGYLFHLDAHAHYPRNGATYETAFIYDNFDQVTNASLDLYTTDAWTAGSRAPLDLKTLQTSSITGPRESADLKDNRTSSLQL